MIKIDVDEAYAFDMLSILEIKALNSQEYDCSKNFDKFSDNIRFQVGVNVFNYIINSIEYRKLLETNLQIFKSLDDLHRGKNEITAEYIDNLNYQRWLCKKELQEKFFSNKITETKIGYNEK